MEKVVNKLIQENIKGCDVYHYGDSIWLIFTDSQEWIVEFTPDDTLWYNHDFFSNLFKYISLNVIENHSYITKWFNFDTMGGCAVPNHRRVSNDDINNIIKNGVKSTLEI
jgi:hypothetical protein